MNDKSRSFVGRDKEIKQLRQCHRDRRHVLIIGSAGIGKRGSCEK
jgi:MoxR-like ATPase